MDTQIIFVRTSKGETELHSATSLLAGDIKRALLMVDGVATLADIEKRAAPSLRATLPALISDLQHKGFIEDKSRFARVPKLVIPSKPTGEIAAQAVNEFDFTAAYRPPTAAILAAEAEKEAMLTAKLKEKQEVVRHLQEEKNAAQALAEAELAKKQAALEARARVEAERRAKELAELAHLKERAIAQARAEAEAAKALARAEAEARMAAELKAQQAAELRARQEAEIEKLKAKQVMLAKAQAEEKAALVTAMKLKERQAAELAELRAEQEKVKQIAERQAKELADRQAKEIAEHQAKELAERQAKELAEHQAKEMARTVNIRVEPHQIRVIDAADASADKTDPNLRTTTVTVLFFDMVAYTKQAVQKQTEMKRLFNQLVTGCLKSVSDDKNEYIILDTGDGAAIGFTHHPEEALEVAMKFREAIVSNEKYASIKVRMGIHLGPINIVVDMNGKPNMVGNGINDAQRVMDFAGENQVFISRSYYDFISRLSDEYAEQFYYRGAQKDKHGHEHQVYALNSRMPSEARQASNISDAPTLKIALAPFTFNDPAHPAAHPKSVVTEPVPPQPQTPKPHAHQPPPSPSPEDTQRIKEARELKEVQAKKKALMAEIEAQKQLEAQAAEAKKLAETQAKAWTQAERRAMETAKINAERAVQQAAHASVASVVKAQKIEVAPRKPFPWKKMLVSLMMLLLLTFGAALYVVPMVMPLQEYEQKTEQFLTEKLQQPVHVGQMRARLLPSPQVTFDDFFMGKANQVRAQRVTINLAIFTLFSPKKTIEHIELEGLKVTSGGFKELGGWLETVASDAAFPIQKITFKQAVLETETFSINEIEGQFIFNAQGRLSLADFRDSGGKLSVSITPIAGQPEFKLTVRNAALPFLPNWLFNELHATGVLSANGLSISQLDASIADGFLDGSMNVAWHSGWVVQGRFNAESLDLQKFNRHLIGDLKGLVHFKMQHGEFKGLVETAALSGNFVATKGVIQGMDLIEILRTRGREKAVGGRTNFDELAGSLTYSAHHYEFQQLNLKKGVLNATGQVSLDQNKLLGRVNASLEIQGEKPTITIEIEGSAEQFNQKVL